ncbi:Solute carrier family 7 member 13 [Aphelenchoides besseyi]|nr:Solute carrier family 7 member 13 [Aphelenchoides besseyi]
MTTRCFLLYPGILTIQSQTFAQYFFEDCQIEVENSIHDYWIKTTVSFSLMSELFFLSTNCLVVFLMLLNMVSVKMIVARFQIATTIAKIGSTFLIIAVRFYYLTVNGWSCLSEHYSICFFSYSGWDILCLGVSGIENPKRTLRLAVLIGIFIVSVVTMATNFSLFLVLSIHEILNSETVVTTFAQKTHVLDAVSHLHSAYWFNELNCLRWISFPGACTNQLSSFLTISNKKHNSPRPAVSYHVIIGMLLTFTGNPVTLINNLFRHLAATSSFDGCHFVYSLQKHSRSFGSCQNATSSAFLFSSNRLDIRDPKAAVMNVGFLIVCLLIYFALIWNRALPCFNCYNYYGRLIDEKLVTLNGWFFDGIIDKTSDEAEEPINKE